MKLDFVADIAAAQKEMEKSLLMAKSGVVKGMRSATDKVKAALRAEVEAAGLGTRLARTWQSKIYGKDSFEATGYVYSRAPELIAAHSKGLRIRSDKGFWLAIPTENAPDKGVGGGRISPSNWPDQRYGGLRFVYRPTGPSFLVVDNVRASYSRKTGNFRGFRRASETAVAKGRGLTTVVMFILVREVSLKKRLDPDAIVKAHTENVPGEILKALQGLRNAR